jgi:prolipoprotein diacylglyceryltransferase
VLVVIIWCSIAFVISFILSHLLLKRWYTLSIPVSFVLAQILIVSAVRSQSMPKEKKEKFLSVLGVKPSPL